MPAAMMVALYAAFWLQLDNAWSAAVTVSIPSMQTTPGRKKAAGGSASV